MYINTWREGVKMTELGSFQCCPVTGPEAMSTNWNTGGPVWTSANTFFNCDGDQAPGTGCPEKLWSLPPWRYSKAIWGWSPFLGDPAWAGGWIIWHPEVDSNLSHSVGSTSHQQVKNLPRKELLLGLICSFSNMSWCYSRSFCSLILQMMHKGI